MPTPTRNKLQEVLCEMIMAHNNGETYHAYQLDDLDKLGANASPQDQDMGLALRELVAEARGTHEIIEVRGEQIAHLANTGDLSEHFMDGVEDFEPYRPG